MSITITRRLCASCGAAFARHPLQSAEAFARRLTCLPCASADEPAQTFTADPADAPPAPLPLLRGLLAAL